MLEHYTMSQADAHEFWQWFFIVHSIATVCYSLIFYGFHNNAEKKGESPKDCLLISTCAISTIHSIICCFGVIIGFFVDELYLPQNQLWSPPGVIAVVWMLWNSYMLTDLVAHLVCFYFKGVEARYDVVAHHLFAYCTVFCLEFPMPIYGWCILCAPLLTEFSTIFMNARWFAKHYHFSHALQERLGTAFLASWFSIRLPALWALIVYLAWHWAEVVDKMPLRIAIFGVVLIGGINALHVVWGVLLIQKILKRRNKKMKVSDFSGFQAQGKAKKEDSDEFKLDKADTETDHLL